MFLTINQSGKLKHKKVILSIGRLCKEKGIHEIIAALPYLDENIILLIVGKRFSNLNYYSELLFQSYKLGVRERVIFLGWVDPKNLENLYIISDIGILVGKVYESLSRFLLDCVNNGLPCIVRDIGGNKEIIINNYNGIILPFNFKTKDLAKNINKLI